VVSLQIHRFVSLGIGLVVTSPEVHERLQLNCCVSSQAANQFHCPNRGFPALQASHQIQGHHIPWSRGTLEGGSYQARDDGPQAIGGEKFRLRFHDFSCTEGGHLPPRSS